MKEIKSAKETKKIVPDPTTEPENPTHPEPGTLTSPPKEPTIPYLTPEKPAT
jgi:hypothetical protein